MDNFIKLLQISDQLLDHKIENELSFLNKGFRKITFFALNYTDRF